jgi:protein transport protein YIF1
MQQPNHEASRHDEQNVLKMPYFQNQEPTQQQPQEQVYQPQSRQHFQLQQQPEARPVQDQMFPMFHSMQGQQQHQYDLQTQQHEEQPQPPYSAHQPQHDRTFMGINVNGALSGSTPYGVGAVPGMPMLLAGMAHQLVSQSGGGGADAAAAIAPHLMQNFGVSQYFSSGQQDTANTFMRLPKNYFEVNHSYVLKKLLLLLIPFTKRSWSRKRAHEQVQFDNAADDSKYSFVPPRDDVNAPDLYIPVMSFVTYVLLVGFIFGTQDAFTAEVLAKYCSKGLGVLTLEVLIIKLGLYLINAQATPWLDVIAYRGYKFVGVIVAMVVNVIKPKLYYFSFLYAAIAMFIFLLRSHRRIILPRELDHHLPADIAQRNAFLLFVCALQFPIYWILILDVRSIVGS